MSISPYSNKKIIGIIIISLAILTSIRCIWIYYYDNRADYAIENGLLNLSDVQLDKNDIILLNGEWLFYPETLLEETKSTEPIKMHVPDTWSSDIDYGTYQMQIIIPDEFDHTTMLGLSLKTVESSAKIYVNGELIDEIGTFASTKENFISHLKTETTYFIPSDSIIDISIEVANFEDLLPGGIPYSIKFGTQDAIESSINFSQGLQLAVFAIMLIHSLYAFSLYLLGRKYYGRELLYFGFLLLFVAFSIVVDEDRVLYSNFPIDTVWSFRIMFISFAGITLFMLLLMQKAFSFSHRLTSILSLSFIILIILLIFSPESWIPVIGPSVSLFSVIGFILITIFLLKAIRNGKSEAIYLLIATIANITNILWGVAINFRIVDFPFYPFDYIVAIMMFSMFLFARHNQLVEHSQKQAEQLRKVDKIKDKFLANTSHELRNPLHGIINITQSVLNDKKRHLDSGPI